MGLEGWAGEHTEVLGETAGKLHTPFSLPCETHLCFLAVAQLAPLIVTWYLVNAGLNSVSCSSR